MLEIKAEIEGRKPHQEDMMVVHNILVDDDFFDEENNYSHKDKFQVRWNGTPWSIRAGEQRVLPRYIANHFAKHLADRKLTHEAELEKREPRLNSATERPRILNQIILGVYEYYGDDPRSEDERVQEKVEEVNNAIGLGTIPDPTLGVLRPDPKPASEILENAKNTPDPVPTPVEEDKENASQEKKYRSKEQLLMECTNLDIDVTGNETRAELEKKIAEFVGR